MSWDELMQEIDPWFNSDKLEDLLKAKTILLDAAKHFEGEQREEISNLVSGIMDAMSGLLEWDNAKADPEEDDGIPTLDVNTGQWKNADKLEG